MTVEIFTLQEFRAVVMDIAHSWGNLYGDFVRGREFGGEEQLIIPIKTFSNHDSVNIFINSSIGTSGVSAASGENSIRGWLADAAGNPLGNKTQKWVTRQTGWEYRLEKMLLKLKEMAESINFCHSCGTIEKVFVTKKDGPNKGRLFKKCQCERSFQWLDDYEQGESEPAEVPSCPQCGGRMVKRNGRMGEFWGCSKYPSCKGTRNIGQEFETVAERQDRQYAVAAKTQEVTGHISKQFIPSPYQQAIFDWVDAGYNGHPELKHLVVEALAGSGKTTTGVEMLKRVPRDQKVLFVAFNKHIAKTLQERAPAHVRATTLHSLGFAALRQAYKLDFNAVKDDKTKLILNNFINMEVHGHLVSPISNLVSLVKANLTDTEDTTLMELASFYGTELNGDAGIIFDGVRYVISKGMEMTNVIDFDDMCWMPVIHGLTCEKYDFIFVDEAQDLNRCQLELALAHCHENTRFVAVGDRYQSLYGFRGADVDSIPNIIEQLQANVLPLSITYRCPKSVVELVNQTFPQIPLESAPSAEWGDISNVRYNQAIMNMRDGDMVLCRVNAPLVRPCFELIRCGVKATIRGREIGKGLISTIRKMKAADLSDLLIKLSDYCEREVGKLLLAKKNTQAQSLEDRIDTIVALADGVFSIRELEAKIDSIFSDEQDGVVFSSVHRAKGLEAKNVFILKPELMPHPKATQDWELQQELNIQYVAYTRTLENLVFVIGY